MVFGDQTVRHTLHQLCQQFVFDFACYANRPSRRYTSSCASMVSPPTVRCPKRRGSQSLPRLPPTRPGRGTSSVPSPTWSWYLALLAASRVSTAPPNAFAPFPYATHHTLIASLDALSDLILRRLFLGIKGTMVRVSWVS